MRNELREIRSYPESLEYLSSFSKQGALVTDLTRFSALSEKLGSPEKRLRCIHVAGTNGKGSVTEYIAAALTESGYKTGRFSSPYIVDIRERIEIDGEFISKEDFTRLAERVRKAEELCENRAFSQFEILTAICFLYFVERCTDCAVIEAGIGGTLDCTNIIPCPEAAVITSIGLDHTAILGDTEEKIAQSKSGIIKGGVCVTAAGIPESAMSVIRRRCEETGARLIIPDMRELTVRESGLTGSAFCYKNREYRVKMCGSHQAVNALTAIEVLNALNVGLPYEKVAAGLHRAVLPARLEYFPKHTPEIILDGGHNPQAMLAAKEVLIADRREKTAIIGMISTKDYKTALKTILPCFKAAVFFDGFADNAVSSEVLADIGKKAGINSYFTHDIRTALTIACEDSELLFIGGSLYMAAEFRKFLTGESHEGD